ncbi:unnamed protein product [Durusdinium trenchii]|uniref:Uncharacterized protein n=1 Tax=Durusdinium trenchii TaxID=1381693 RepID=A0ABP0SBW6_9DINO
MGKELTDQLQACAVKLNQMAESLQSKVREKRNKNKHYRDLLAQVDEIRKLASERVNLAKALICAVDKKPRAKAKPDQKPDEKGSGAEEPLPLTDGKA